MADTLSDNGGDDVAVTTLSLGQDASKEARIAQRKARIEIIRLQKQRQQTETEDASSRRKAAVQAGPLELGKSKSQISSSRKKLEIVKQTGTEIVSNVQIDVTSREASRRMEEVKKTDLLASKRIVEKETSESIQKEIASQWSKVLAYEGPYQLSNMFVEQQKMCSKLMETKNALLSEFTSELKSKDDEYVKELKRQAEEIDVLLERMENQYRTFQQSLQNELSLIERAFMEERTELIESNIKEVEGLFDQRRNGESKYMEERSDKIEDHVRQLENLRVQDSEEYSMVKIKLETDVQILEQQLHQMRATYQLNTEKLEYNFQVLKKREEENGTILGAQKRKINRLTDVMNSLKTKIAKQEKNFQTEYASLTEDYKRITEQFKELQKKFRHFQMSDLKRYKDIWKMNEELARESIRKILQADRIIYEQQLGLDWIPPVEDFFDDGPVKEDKEFSQSDDREKESLAGKLKEMKGYNKTLKKILELLCNEAGFLVEDKLHALLVPLHKDERSLMKLDSIFKALNIETVEDIERLTGYFVEAKFENNNDDVELIHPNEVVKALRTFLEAWKEAHSPQEDKSTDVNIPMTKSKDTKREYWEKMGHVVDDKKLRVWNAVHSAMGNYHSLLASRYTLTQDIDSISQQNEELKQLLRQYMSSKVNDELCIPPTQILLAQAGLRDRQEQTLVESTSSREKFK